MSEEKETKSYKKTLNLPQTDFPIRAGLAQKEPELVSQWEKEDAFSIRHEAEQSSPTSFILHDGPPYPNGNIHMGHALNKILKDMIVRYNSMAGHRTHYVPGWDCHGLPIETQVVKELKSQGQEEKKNDVAWFRNRCKEFALNYVDTQKDDFKKLGIWGDWKKPYLTLNPEYERHVIRLFGQMAENGLIYKGRKPIHWCMSCETALAEAEIEYDTHRSPSIFVRFTTSQQSEKLNAITGGKNVHLLVWTTTPWTLPSNVALAAHPDFTYSVIKHGEDHFVVVDNLVDHLREVLEWGNVEVLGSLNGSDLKGTISSHPFIERESPVVNANYVSNEDGTGFVHIAPGHGQDDYIVGNEYDLPTIMPVDDSGRYTDELNEFGEPASQWVGQKVLEANRPICEHMESTGSLEKLKMIKHSYPHCWRCKDPVIFRATEQWFVAMDTPTIREEKTLRQLALDAISEVKWVPDWGETRIRTMVENRPDWCISRQRYWGIPIPVFNCEDCGHSEMTGPFNDAVQKLVAEHGTLAWFKKDVSEILPEGLKCSKCGSVHFKKETDILDVWFESGSSFGSVLEGDQGLGFPSELYLEGSDQHRGWFQSSLLIGLAATGKAPYKEVLTHGFIVDEHGKKMSKSVGNVISPEKVIKEYGADILRWWVANTDFKNDVHLSKNVLNQARDSFLKVRNTIRFCLSNLYDFDETTDLMNYEDLNEIDQWALGTLAQLSENVHDLASTYDFHLVTKHIHEYCTNTLSSLYLDMLKDRLYCDQANGHNRRSSQSAIYWITKILLELCAPIMAFTAEDAYTHFHEHNAFNSIHFAHFTTLPGSFSNSELMTKWARILDIKDTVYQQLEQLRNDKKIGSFLEATVSIHLEDYFEFDDWATVLIVAEAKVEEGASNSVAVTVSEHEKCERCWRRLPLKNGICERCTDAIAANPQPVETDT